MTPKDAKTLETVLTVNLARTIDFVKFGEAKNAALLTFTSAWILASVTVAMSDTAEAVAQVRYAVMFGGPFIVLAAVLALLSFLPRTDLKLLSGGDEDPDCSPNYLYFGHLRDLQLKRVAQALGDRYLEPGGKGVLGAVYFGDLGCQIGANARVATMKFRLFAWGVRTLLIGLGIYLFGAVRLLFAI